MKTHTPENVVVKFTKDGDSKEIQLKEKEDGVLGEYILEHEMSFRAGLSTFTLDPGFVVDVIQEDNQHNKVLIVFDESTVDWYHTSILNNFKKVKNK